MGPTSSAGEAIEKILQEKKVSLKINYDVLKSLNATFAEPPAGATAKDELANYDLSTAAASSSSSSMQQTSTKYNE